MRILWSSVVQALLSLKNEWWRAGLSLLGIIIGVSAVITILAVGEGAESLITGSIAKVGTRTITVLSGASEDTGPPAAAMGIVTTTLTADDAEAIAQLPHVNAVTPVLQGTETLSWKGQQTNVQFEGVGHQHPVVEGADLSRGRFFTAAESRSADRVIVLGANVATDIFDTTNPMGESVKLGNEKYTIIGLYAAKGAQVFGSPDDSVYIPVKTAQRRLLGVDYVQLIRLQASEENLVNITMDRVRGLLRTRHQLDRDEDDDYSVRSIAQALTLVTGLTGAVRAFLTLMAAVSLLVGGIGIMNIALMNVKSRTKEIGLRMALGATRQQIAQQFLIETLMTTLMGGILGTAFGVALSYGISRIAVAQGYAWDFAFNPLWAFAGIGVALVTGLVFGVSPARNAASADPINALRSD